MVDLLKEIQFDEKGLIPVVTQDHQTKEVLMLAYANREAVEKTLETGKVHYFSRSRNVLWLKGESSGHFQFVKEIFYDCDGDTLLIQVAQVGSACHTGNKSCFYRNVSGNPVLPKVGENVLKELHETILDRKVNPKEGSYTNYLFEKGIDKTLKKVGEESAEVIIASKNDDKKEIVYEMADLCYHLTVLMAQTDVTWEDVLAELVTRR